MGYTVHGILQARILQWVAVPFSRGSSLFQGIFPTQGLNPGLLHCGWIFYQLSHKGSPRKLEWVTYPFSSRPSWPRNQTRVFCIAGGFFTNWAISVVPNTRMKAQKSTSSLLRFLRWPRNSIPLPHVGREQLRHKQSVRRCQNSHLGSDDQDGECGFLRTALPNTDLVMCSSEIPCFLQNPVLSSSHLILTSPSLIWLPFSLHFLS